MSPAAIARALLVAAFTLVLGCASSAAVGRTPAGASVIQIPLRLSNVYLIPGRRPVLVDTGTVGDMEDLSRALEDNGVLVSSLCLVIVTHGHADHAGLAADLRATSGARIVLGAGDLPLARVGHNDELKPTSLTASLLKPFIPLVYPEFEPDIVVREPLDLKPWGIDGQVIAMPGHTAGSVVVVLANRTAFVGDMMLGGSFGGMLFPHSPGEHYYQADPAQNRRNIATLVGMGIETFYLGHGGPVSRADVIQAFAL